MIDTTSDWHAIITKGLKTGQKGLEYLWMPITEDVGHMLGIMGLNKFSSSYLETNVTLIYLFLKSISLQVKPTHCSKVKSYKQ